MNIAALLVRIDAADKKMWPNGEGPIREYLVPMLVEFAKSNCCDTNYLCEFESSDKGVAASRIWEAMLSLCFCSCGRSVSEEGRDQTS